MDTKIVVCMWWVKFQVLCLRCLVLSGSSMVLVGIFLRYSDLFLKFLFGTSLWCGLSDVCSAGVDVTTFLSFMCLLVFL